MNVLSLTTHPSGQDADGFRAEVIEGLRQPQKQLKSKYLYDQRGSHLFEEICRLDEYYPTRTEIAILRDYAHDIAERLGPSCFLIEYGSGSARKIRILLDALVEPAAYVPVDISKQHLLESARQLAVSYPALEILPVCADFTEPFELPRSRRRPRRRVVFFPGSTVGNFEPAVVRRFLRSCVRVCGSGGGLLIGVDLKKDRTTLERAYNDARGVTAAFNLNLLVRINRELDGDFDLDCFRHQAHYNSQAGRIEMHLVSTTDQTVHIGETQFTFKAGESILSEWSYKHGLDEFRSLALETGFCASDVWTDPDRLFSVWYLTVP